MMGMTWVRQTQDAPISSFPRGSWFSWHDLYPGLVLFSIKTPHPTPKQLAEPYCSPIPLKICHHRVWKWALLESWDLGGGDLQARAPAHRPWDCSTLTLI